MVPNSQITDGTLAGTAVRARKPLVSLPFHLDEVPQIFKRKGFYRKMHFLFWRLLCPYPDQTKIGMWWYGVSARIAGYFNEKANHIPMPREKYHN